MMPLLLTLAVFWLQSGVPPVASAEYYVVFLRPDPARKPLSKPDGDRIQAAHMANIHKMADDGVLRAAGPFEDESRTISGIFVFKAPSLAEAERIARQDPTVTEHRNTVDVYRWHGPAAIGEEYFRLHKEHPETPENMGVHPLFLMLRGPRWNHSAAEKQQALTAHRAYRDRLRAEGKLAAAGDTGEDSLVDITIFRRIQPEEAQRLINDDPAVKSGVLRPELHRWWCADHVLPW
jgi:uncharacterized protein YciI